MNQILLGDRTVDLEQPIRLVKPAHSGVPAFTCEGVLAEGIEGEASYGDVMRFRLVFHGGATAEWVPELGDVLMNLEDDQ